MIKEIYLKKPVKMPGLDLQYFWLLVPLITIIELVFAYWNTRVGIFLHFILFGTLITVSYISFKDCTPRLCLSLLLIPLMRIFSIALPLAELPFPLWYLIIGIPLFLAAFSVIKLAGFSCRELGFTTEKLPQQLLYAPLGIPIGFMGHFILKHSFYKFSFALQDILYSAVILIVCTGFLEELIFRGMIYRAAKEKMGTKQSLILVSLINAAMHISNLSFLHVVFVFLLAVLITEIYERQRSIIGVSLLHGLVNIILFLISPLLIK